MFGMGLAQKGGGGSMAAWSGGLPWMCPGGAGVEQ